MRERTMLSAIVPPNAQFSTNDAAFAELKALIEPGDADSSELSLRVVIRELGYSEGGRPMFGAIAGTGDLHVSLVAGAHADEPVGPETLRAYLKACLERHEATVGLLKRFTFYVVPHVNPDGEAANQDWIAGWPDIEAYLEHVVRELPGRDVEFGYPDMRIENRNVAQFLVEGAPYCMHASLHSMGFAEGGLLLIEKHWTDRTADLRDSFVRFVNRAGMGVHDQDRKGDKGFQYLGPGFWTTPEGAAMRAYFDGQGDPLTAALFHDSSMEYIRSLGGDPLCLVTEIPLFLLKPEEPRRTGVPGTFLRFKDELAVARAAGNVSAVRDLLARYCPKPVSLDLAMRLQLDVLETGLGLVR